MRRGRQCATGLRHASLWRCLGGGRLAAPTRQKRQDGQGQHGHTEAKEDVRASSVQLGLGFRLRTLLLRHRFPVPRNRLPLQLRVGDVRRGVISRPERRPEKCPDEEKDAPRVLPERHPHRAAKLLVRLDLPGLRDSRVALVPP